MKYFTKPIETAWFRLKFTNNNVTICNILYICRTTEFDSSKPTLTSMN